MIRWFLGLFRAYHEMAATLASSLDELDKVSESRAELVTQALILQDRLDATLADRDKLWSTVQEALRGERSAYQAHINMAWQKQNGGIPYPDAPHLPDGAVPPPQAHDPIPRRELPSESVARRTNQFYADLESRRH